MRHRPRATAPGPAVALGTIAVAGCCASLGFLLVRAAIKGLVFAGPYSALAPTDQLRYLAWIRQAGQHLLIADPYRAGAPHVYLHPMFAISGLLWRVGLSVQAAYLAWTPIALLVLIAGYARYTGRFCSRGERVAALALSLLFFSPLVPLLDWGKVVDANGANQLVIAAGQAATFWQAWGYLPTVVGLGLMPVFLVGVERLLSEKSSRKVVLGTALAGLLVAWLHPWGGIELIAIVVALLVLRRLPRGCVRVALAGTATALPLVYYALLARADPQWSLSELRVSFTIGAMWWSLLAALAPLLLAGLLALRRPRQASEQILLLWPLAVLAVYVVLGADSRLTALEGVSLPLSILAVRGWRRISVHAAVGTAAVAVAIVPGMVYSAATGHDELGDRTAPYALSRGEQDALDALAHEPGRVLSTPYLALALPALTGRMSVIDPLVQQPGWTPARLDGLFDGRFGPGQAQALIEQSAITIVISDCLPGRADLTKTLGRLGFQKRRYGCAAVYRHTARYAPPPATG